MNLDSRSWKQECAAPAAPSVECAAKDQTGRLTVGEAGRLGGLSTLARHGVDHYRKAGRKGQARFNAQFSKAQRSLWGATGGRPRRLRLGDMGEKEQFR